MVGTGTTVRRQQTQTQDDTRAKYIRDMVRSGTKLPQFILRALGDDPILREQYEAIQAQITSATINSLTNGASGNGNGSNARDQN